MDIGRATFDAKEVELNIEAAELVEGEIKLEDRTLTATAVRVGNPHCVVFKVDGQAPEDAEALTALAQTLGPKLEHLPLYPQRTNVQFVRGSRPSPAGDRDLGARRGVHAGLGHVKLRGSGGGDPHRPLRKPGHGANARRRDAGRDCRILVRAPDRDRVARVQG